MEVTDRQLMVQILINMNMLIEATKMVLVLSHDELNDESRETISKDLEEIRWYLDDRKKANFEWIHIASKGNDES